MAPLPVAASEHAHLSLLNLLLLQLLVRLPDSFQLSALVCDSRGRLARLVAGRAVRLARVPLLSCKLPQIILCRACCLVRSRLGLLLLTPTQVSVLA